MSKNRIYLPLLVLGTAFWGISFPLSKNVFHFIDPYTFMFYRFFIAAIFIALVFHKQAFKMNRTTVKKSIISGIFLFMGVCWQTVGLKYTNSSNAAFIAGIEVILIPLFAFFFLKKDIQTKVWVACFLALIGLYTIAMTSGFAELKIGDIFVFIGSLFYSVYVLYVGKVNTDTKAKLNMIPFVFIQLFVCSISAGTLAISTQGIEALNIPQSIEIWEVLLFVGILSTAYMYCVQNIAQKYIEAEKIALTYLCEPIFATIFAYILLNEDISDRTIVGGSLILLSMFIAEANMKAIYKKIKAFVV